MQKNLVVGLAGFLFFVSTELAYGLHDDGAGADDETPAAAKKEKSPTRATTEQAPVNETPADRSIECIQSICKPVEGVEYAKQRLKKEFNKMVQGIADKKVDYSDAFRKHILAIEAKLKIKRELEKSLASRPFKTGAKTIDPETQTYFNQTMLLPLTRYMTRDGQGSIKALKEAGYSEDVAKWAVQAVTYSLDPNLFEMARKARMVPASNYLTDLYGGENQGAKEVLKNYVGLLKDLDDKKSNLGGLLRWQAHTPNAEEILKKLEAGEDVARKDLRKLPDLDIMTRTAKRILAEGSPVRPDFVPPNQTESQGMRFDLKAIVEGLGGPAKVAENNAKKIDMIDAASKREIEICKGNYLYQRAIHPTEKQVDALGKIVDKAKDRIQEKYLSGYSEKTRETMEHVVNNSDFFLPPAREDAEDRWGNSLSRAEASLSASIEWMQKAVADKKSKFPDVFAAFIMTQNNIPKEDLCNDLLMSDFNDAMVDRGGVLLGPATAAMDPESQMNTVMHELSHVVSTAFRAGSSSGESAGKYRKLKMCLRDIHPEAMSPRMNERAGESFTTGKLTEEDLADWVAATATGETKLNVWCHVMDSNADGTGWEQATTTPVPGDGHSGYLFRLMLHEQLRGKPLGEACKETLAKSHGVGAIKSCNL